MRYYPLLFCLMAGLSLHAQRDAQSPNGWEISASFAPEFRKRVPLTGVRFETDPGNIPVSQRPNNGYDTISVAGQDRIFNRGTTFGLNGIPTDANFWFGATVSAHRRIGRGFNFSAGLFYNQAEYFTGVADEIIRRGPVNTNVSGSFIFNLEEISVRSLGLTLRGNYHLFPEHRLHPYFGMGANVYYSLRDQHSVGRVYLGESVQILPLSTPVSDVSTSQINLDFVATAGLLYRISAAWSVGLDITSTPVLGPGLVGVQVRRGL